jgi:hypothetical protein
MSLINAAADGDVVNIRRLVAEGADVNVQDAEGGSPATRGGKSRACGCGTSAGGARG